MTALKVEVAATADQLGQARALRHAVFVSERGAQPASEADRFDENATHLILTDGAAPQTGVVGTLRFALGAAYTEQEFDLSALRSDPRPLAEIGRMCLHPAYRGGVAGVMLLARAAQELRGQGVGLLVGTGSFPGTQLAQHLPALRALRQAALAPPAFCPTAHGAGAVDVAGPGAPSDMAQVPALIKGYLRAGAWVGEGAWIDHAFNTIDVCLVLDMARMRVPQAALREGLAP